MCVSVMFYYSHCDWVSVSYGGLYRVQISADSQAS